MMHLDLIGYQKVARARAMLAVHGIVSNRDINVPALEGVKLVKLVKLNFAYPYPSSFNTNTNYLL